MRILIVLISAAAILNSCTKEPVLSSSIVVTKQMIEQARGGK